MTQQHGQMRLGAFHYISGHHIAAWRHPEASRDDRFDDVVNFARSGEPAKIVAVFLADSVDARLSHPDGAARKAHTGMTAFEPLTLLSALAAVTGDVGLIGTASATFSGHYNLARQQCHRVLASRRPQPDCSGIAAASQHLFASHVASPFRQFQTGQIHVDSR